MLSDDSAYHPSRRQDRTGVSVTVTVLAAVVLLLASLTACGPKKGSGGCVFVRPKIIAVGIAQAPAAAQPEELPKPRPKPPKPKPTQTKERKKNCDKQNSPIWNGYRPTKNGWRTDGTSYYRWDTTHKDIEKYSDRGKHQGSVDPATGKLYRGPQKTHDLPKSKRDW